MLDHIFNNYKNIIKLQGGNNLFNSIIGDSNDWLSISKEFNNKKLVGKWLSRGFNYQQVQRLAKNLGSSFNPTDASFYAWLRDNNQLVIEKILDNESIEELKRTYYYQLQKEEAKLEDTHDWRNQQLKPEEIKSIIRHFQEEFSKWTSGNSEIDKFIQRHQLEATKPREILEWIPYEQFKNIEYLTEGGFGKVYKTRWTKGPIMKWNNENNQWERYKHETGEVVLKSLNNSQNITTDFLQEVAYHRLIDSSEVVSCYGISQDPTTKNYLMVMQYMKEGDLRQYLRNNYSKMDFEDKLYQLYTIALGLKEIHQKNLVHRDFHPGNILSDGESCYITDLGLSRSVNERDRGRGNVYGVMPYVAPEVLLGKPYTQVSDIYSFGIIAWEILSGKPPYHNVEHDGKLASDICLGLRPVSNIKMPELLKDLIERCWDANPIKRPTSNELNIILRGWYDDILHQKNTEFFRQVKETKEYNKTLPEEIRFPKYEIHPQASYISKPINTKLLITKLLSSKEASLDLNNIANFGSEYCTTELDLDIDIKMDQEDLVEDLVIRTKRQLSIDSQVNTSQGETKLIRLEEELEYYSEPIEIDYTNNWTNLNPNFTDELIQSWTNQNFTPPPNPRLTKYRSPTHRPPICLLPPQ